MEEYNVPVGVRNGSGYTELLIVSFIPDISENKNLPISINGAFSGVFSSCLSLFSSTQCRSTTSAPACEKPAKRKIKMTFITQAVANVPIQADNARKLKWSGIA